MTGVTLRPATEADVPAMLDLINSFARRNLLLLRTEASLRARLADFTVAQLAPSNQRQAGVVVACAALSPLGPGLGEVRSLAVREDCGGQGIGHALVEHLLEQAAERGFVEVLALTRRVPFFEALGFTVTRRERFLDKLVTDCQSCPMSLRCDETAVVRPPRLPVSPLTPTPLPSGERGEMEAR